MAALVTLPTYQPIRDDLIRINERNRTIRKVTELIDGVSRQLETGRRSPDSSQPPSRRAPLLLLHVHRETSLADILRDRGPAYVSYALLRVYDVTDSLANLIGRALNYERESSYFYAIRCIVRAWREMLSGTEMLRGRKSEQVATPTEHRGLPTFNFSRTDTSATYRRSVPSNA